MLKNIIVFSLLSIITVVCNAQADKIIGYYYAIGVESKEESQVEIFKNPDGTYSGKIIWLKNPLDKNGMPKTDKKNPDTYWRNHSIIGMEILLNFIYDKEKNCWNGRGYNPGNGKFYKSKITFESETRLKLRGYIGTPIFGSTIYWEKENFKRK